MICFPNAKINLGLNITSKREDGFHNLESIFIPVPIKDCLEIIESNNGKTEFFQYGIPIDGSSENNLILKALQLIKKDFNLPEIHICLQKNIPIGAGLGGGSADGAFMLKLLNDFFNLNISIQKMEEYALQLGSDCPFFIQNKIQFTRGRGEILTPIQFNQPDIEYFYLVNPNIHISTKDAFAGIIPAQKEIDLLKAIECPLSEWKNLIHNDFEKTVFSKYPVLNEIKAHLYSKGASYVSMTGTGSSIYAFSSVELSLDFPDEYYIHSAEWLPTKP